MWPLAYLSWDCQNVSFQSMTFILYSCQQWLFLLKWFYPWKLVIIPKKEGVAMVLSSAKVSLYTNEAQQPASESLIVWKYSHAVTFSANFLLLRHKAGQTEDWAREWCQPRLRPGLLQLPPHLIKRFWTCFCILRPSCKPSGPDLSHWQGVFSCRRFIIFLFFELRNPRRRLFLG